MKQKLTLLVAFCALLFTQANAQVNLQSGLVAYYPLDGNVNDAGPNARNGSSVGGVLATDRFSRANRAYSLAGGSKLLATIPDIPQGSVDKTVSIWAKWSGLSYVNAANIVNWGPADTGQMFGVGIYKNTHWYTFGFLDTLGYDLSSGVVADSTAWHHIVGIYESGVMKIFVDGVLKASQTKALNTGYTYLFVGNRTDEPADSYYTGLVDDIRIYNRAINQAEITALFTEVPVGVAKIKYDDLGCSIYPNPAKDVLHVKNAKAGYQASIYDITGKLITTKTLTATGDLNIGDLPNNAQYLLKITSEGKSQTEKFVK